jgi:hypothetical protein
MKTNFYLIKSAFLGLAMTAAVSASAQDARVQIIHNSPDAATQSVDIFAGTTEIFSNVDFRTATPFFDLAAGTYTIGLAVASPTNSSTDAVQTFPITVASNETYIVIANGIFSGTGYSPSPALTLDVYAMGQEEATTAGETDVLVFHGSTDAPTVDVITPGGMTPLVDDAAYGDFAGYLNLPTDDYVLNVTDATGATVVRSYEAPLATLGLEDSALVVVASGFLDPSNNSMGEEFGLWVALPEGGALIELPTAEARLQVIHNSADALAASVDIYFNGDLLEDDFDFRTATPFIDVPAEVENEIAIAPSTSTSVGDAVATVPVTFSTGETYVAIANGILSPSGYSPAPAFSLDTYTMGQETATTTGNTDVLVFHGSTDAPTVDVATPGAMTPLVDNAAYGDFAGYLNLPTDDYILEVQDETGSTVVASYSAPLATLNLDDLAIVVVASGFLDPAQNSNGAAFGLWVALPSGGGLVELPTAFASINENELEAEIFPNPAEDFIQINGVTEEGIYELTDLSGKVLIRNQITPATYVDVDGLASGTYILSVRTETQSLTRKIMVK